LSCRWLFIYLLALTCGPAPAWAEQALLIWVSAGRDAAALRTLAAQYQAETGVPVVVAAVDPVGERFAAAAAQGEGPDIVLVGHDSMGGLATEGLITPVNPPTGWTSGILPVAMDAVRFDGSTWGYPVTVEALHLIYNHELISQPPDRFEDIPALPLPRGNRRILWDYTNPYFTMPLLMAGGGYAFAKVEGRYDPATTGVNAPGAIAGAEMLSSLVTDQFLPPDMTYQIMDDAMNGGRVAMVINGPWAWANLAISGINFGVAPIPSVAGHASPAYVTVQALAINSASANRELAKTFIETALTSDAGLAVWNANGALGALADDSAAATLSDPNFTALRAIAAAGVPLPNNPEMVRFWQVMRDALTDISSGAATPTDALNAAAARISETGDSG
jgi:maltose/maltodextrin transport system substrate-binding protein